jgi:hypothetical protein
LGRYGLLLGCLLLLASIFGFVQWMKTYEVKVTTAPALMAKQYIPAFTVIKEDMVYIEPIDIRLKNDNAIHDPTLLIGKTTSIPIGTNEQFVKWKVDRRNLFPKPGESYFTFKADAISSVGNMVRRGDTVEIWLEINEATLQQWKDKEPRQQVPAAMHVIEDAVVAYVKDGQGNEVIDQTGSQVEPFFFGKNDIRDQADHEQFRKTASADTVSVTYILTNEQYERIVRAARYGNLKMGLSWSFETETFQGKASSVSAPLEFQFQYWIERIEGSLILQERGEDHETIGSGA